MCFCNVSKQRGVDSPEAAKHRGVSMNVNATECGFWFLTTCSGRLQREWREGEQFGTDVNEII